MQTADAELSLSLQSAIARYGAIVDGVWSKESDWLTQIDVPDGLELHFSEGGRVRHIRCNKDIAGPLSRALQNVVDRGLAHELKTFGGCFTIRSIRGRPGVLSTHSYGLGADFNPETNQLGPAGNMSAELRACFTDEGAVWGGEFSRCDPMHFQWGGW
jgi:hypothetical protein